MDVLLKAALARHIGVCCLAHAPAQCGISRQPVEAGHQLLLGAVQQARATVHHAWAVGLEVAVDAHHPTGSVLEHLDIRSPSVERSGQQRSQPDIEAAQPVEVALERPWSVPLQLLLGQVEETLDRLRAHQLKTNLRVLREPALQHRCDGIQIGEMPG